jgi:hypothetical protein
MSDLEQRLTALGEMLEVPATPDLVAGVRARMTTVERGSRRPPRRTVALAALAFAVLLAGTALAVTPVRHAIEDVFDLRGAARVQRVPRLRPLPPGAARSRGLGERIPLARARSAASFRALLPGARATAAYLSHDVAGGRITIRAGGALITEFRGTVGPFLLKQIGPGARTRRVRVDGAPALYIHGAPHELLFTDADGLVRPDTVRLAGNVLLWRRGPLILRIEGTHSLAAALRLARSLQ